MGTELPRETPLRLDWRRRVEEAYARIRPYVQRTPVVAAPFLGRGGTKVSLKLENRQHSGSFKYRGAMNKLLVLGEEARRRGVVVASSGNHGLAVARGLGVLGGRGRVYLPRGTAAVKVNALRELGARWVFFGEDCIKTEREARRVAGEEGVEYVSPYNDLEVVAGQGTVALELLSQWPRVEVVLATVGGGGLVGGMASYLKAVRPEVEVIGCQPRNSAVMWHSIQAGGIVDVPSLPTLSEASAGGIEEDSVTFPLCREWVDDFLLVDEGAIAEALAALEDELGQPVEGAAAVAVAAYVENRRRFAGRRAALVVCGANRSRE